ncbi:MAG TPA: MFS transporter [Polyangiaceae bacterium]|nr:MFS transporter [Polyangiaceae bacterium]
MGSTRNRSFRRFWLGQAISNLGDAFGFVAMPLLVFETTHSVLQMGYVTAVTGAGQLLSATFAGVVVDRVNRRRLMIGCDAARLVLYGALPLLSLFGALPMSVIYGVALLTALASNLFLVAYMAAVSNLVEPGEVASANGRLQATQALCFVIGSALAGGVCARFGPVWAVGVNALSFAASAASLSSLRFRRDRAERDPNEALAPLAEIAAGLRYLVGHRVLRSLTLFQTGVALLGSIGVGAAVIDLVVYRLRVDLAESGGVVGFSLALAALGAVLGALSGGRLARRAGLGTIGIVGTAVQGLGLVLGGWGRSLGLVIVSGMLWSGGLTFRAVAVTSLRQRLTPDALLGRVLAAGWTLIFAASSLGAVLVTRAGAVLGAGSAMKLVGALLLVVAASASASPLFGAQVD